MVSRATYQPREVMFREGDHCSHLYVLRSGQTKLTNSLPERNEIAEMMGLSTETVSRTMAQLQREAIIIAPRGSIRILDVDRLRPGRVRLSPALAVWIERKAEEHSTNTSQKKWKDTDPLPYS